MYESAPWRTELRLHAVTIRESCECRYSEVPFSLERAILYSAFVLRKLMEDRKLTDEFCDRIVRAETFVAAAPEIGNFWRDLPGSVELNYEHPQPRDVSIKELCSQVIHNLARDWWLDDDDEIAASLIVSSYRAQDRIGYRIILSEWADLLDEAAASIVTEFRWVEGEGWVYR